MCKDNIFILPIILSDILPCYNKYTIHPGMDITDAMIHQHLCCPEIRDSFWKEVTNCESYQRKK